LVRLEIAKALTETSLGTATKQKTIGLDVMVEVVEASMMEN
jgi:hypothetical protein